MKYLARISVIVLLSLPVSLESTAQEKNKTAKDSSPAEKIVQFWFVMIKSGPKQDFDSAAKAKLFSGHMQNMARLYEDGILKVAGPFGKNDLDWRGIFILDCSTKEEATKHVMTDPAVAAGLFDVVIVPWFGEPSGSFKKGKPEKKDQK